MKNSNLWHPDRAAPTDPSYSSTKTGQDDGHKRAAKAPRKVVPNLEFIFAHCDLNKMATVL